MGHLRWLNCENLLTVLIRNRKLNTQDHIIVNVDDFYIGHEQHSHVNCQFHNFYIGRRYWYGT